MSARCPENTVLVLAPGLALGSVKLIQNKERRGRGKPPPLKCPSSTARKQGKDAVVIADQDGWARHSRSMNGYFQIEDGWEDNSIADLM
ncbi:hypothetical protein AB0F46_39415 [Streptomyces sp. NPDC026665]|uniref:hypothetical protein n=1 Tax=Streptomyces sp. NPDC026665 TaxID=3154798 RepID=UPI003405066B